MVVQIEHAEDVIHVHVQGHLSKGTYAEEFKAIRTAFSNQPRDVVMDMEDVEHLSSFAIASILRLQEFIQGEDRDLKMVNPSEHTKFVLEKSGMSKYFKFLLISHELEEVVSERDTLREDRDRLKCACPQECMEPVHARLVHHVFRHQQRGDDYEDVKKSGFAVSQ